MNNKTVALISQARATKKEMVALARTSPDVQQYLRLQGKRERLHKKLSKHIKRYSVQYKDYKKYGLVAQNRSTVKATDTHKLAQEIGGETGKRIFNLINQNLVVWTK
jgi:hypothetical protein